ncbi:TIGR02588 family protein [Allorhizobium pseudoryzae]|uniref:TIGR02588 family protein n=1 Tax=Allorhizobium pseudoryzae TaxID=379684 RepID=UPI003CFFD810
MTITNSTSKRQMEPEQGHWIEWTTGVVSILLVLALVGFIGWEALTKSDETPELAVRVADIAQKGEVYVVRLELDNRSPATAAAVRVTGSVTAADGTAEVSETTFDYAPAESTTKGGLLFRQNPLAGRLEVRATGYTEP